MINNVVTEATNTNTKLENKMSNAINRDFSVSPSQLVAIGGANWDLYASGNGKLVSIPKPGNDASASYYGDRAHVKKLIANGWFTSTLTDFGFEYLSFNGLHSRLITPRNGKTFGLLSH